MPVWVLAPTIGWLLFHSTAFLTNLFENLAAIDSRFDICWHMQINAAIASRVVFHPAKAKISATTHMAKFRNKTGISHFREQFEHSLCGSFIAIASFVINGANDFICNRANVTILHHNIEKLVTSIAVGFGGIDEGLLGIGHFLNSFFEDVDSLSPIEAMARVILNILKLDQFGDRRDHETAWHGNLDHSIIRPREHFLNGSREPVAKDLGSWLDIARRVIRERTVLVHVVTLIPLSAMARRSKIFILLFIIRRLASLMHSDLLLTNNQSFKKAHKAPIGYGSFSSKAMDKPSESPKSIKSSRQVLPGLWS